MPTMVPVDGESYRDGARLLVSEYLQWINESAQREYGLSFDVAAMVASDMSDTEKFHPPCGRFYVVQEQTAFVAVGCLKRLDTHVGELQRMYVRPAFRGRGIGQLIVERLISDARQIGYRKLRLESLKFLAIAHALYRSAGFVEIEPYAGNSMGEYQAPNSLPAYQSHVVFMEMTL